MMSNTFILLLAVDVILLAGFMLIPVMRGEDAFFGVRVSEEVYRGEGRRVLHRYWFWLVLTFIEIEALWLFFSLYKRIKEFLEVARRRGRMGAQELLLRLLARGDAGLHAGLAARRQAWRARREDDSARRTHGRVFAIEGGGARAHR